MILPPSSPAKLARYAGLYRALLTRGEHMCLCGLLAAEATTLPEAVRAEVRGYFVEHEAWLGGVLATGRAAGLLRVEGALPDAAQRVLAGIEGALLVAQAHDDDARFDALAAGLLADLRAIQERVRSASGTRQERVRNASGTRQERVRNASPRPRPRPRPRPSGISLSREPHRPTDRTGAARFLLPPRPIGASPP